METLCKRANSVAHLTNFSFEFFYKIFTEDASLPLLYHGAKKSKMTKNSNQGGPDLRDRLEHLENLQSSSFARLLLDSMQQAESTLFSTVTGTHPLRTWSTAGVLVPEQMCCHWQLLAVQPRAESNGAGPAR